MKANNWNWVRVLVVALSLVAGIGSYLWRQKQDALPPPSAHFTTPDMDEASSYSAPLPQETTGTSSDTAGDGTPTVSTSTGTPNGASPATASSTAAQPTADSHAGEWEQHITAPTDGASSAAVPSMTPSSSPPPAAVSAMPAYSSPAYSSAAPTTATASPSDSTAPSDSGSAPASSSAY